MLAVKTGRKQSYNEYGNSGTRSVSKEIIAFRNHFSLLLTSCRLSIEIQLYKVCGERIGHGPVIPLEQVESYVGVLHNRENKITTGIERIKKGLPHNVCLL